MSPLHTPQRGTALSPGGARLTAITATLRHQPKLECRCHPRKPRDLDRTVPGGNGVKCPRGGNRMPRILTSSAPRLATTYTLCSEYTTKHDWIGAGAGYPRVALLTHPMGVGGEETGDGHTSRLFTTLALRWCLLATNSMNGVRERRWGRGRSWRNSVAHGVSSWGSRCERRGNNTLSGLGLGSLLSRRCCHFGDGVTAGIRDERS